ncbi:MAG: hypothetical protein ACM31C_22640 [Acidobacteriota bacterium]
MTIEISGDATTWSGTPTVSLGDGVTVGTVSLASPTDLFADITIADSAAIGKRDVTVMSGGKSYTLTQAFELQSPVSVTTTGSVAQGSVAGYTIRQLDFGAPFDSTCGFSFFGFCLLYTNMSVAAPAGVTATVDSVADYVVQGRLLIDVDAAAAGGALTVTSGPSGSQVTSTVGTPLAITARQATALTAGTAASGTVANAGESGLFSFSATTGTAVPFTVSTQAQAPSLYLLPSTGHWSDMSSTGAVDSSLSPLFPPQVDAVATTSDTYYVVYVDDGSVSNYSVKASPVTLTAVAESDMNSANDMQANAQSVSKAALVTNASLNGVNDQDWYMFTIAAGDVGKHVHVTTSGDPATDTVVDVFGGAAGATDLGGGGVDAWYQEDVLSDPIPAGTTTVYVQIKASTGFNSGHNTYTAAIWLE